ncbi:MAG TPA: hypothetical protein VN578_00540 [Candidatus Binatia bacterium]|jgi:hypothetical protein|nr:hypothetical protein [Candidatus Binatia bacterium]
MKTRQFWFFLALVCLLGAAAIGNNVSLRSRTRGLEQRLQKLESAPPRLEAVETAGSSARVQALEQQVRCLETRLSSLSEPARIDSSAAEVGSLDLRVKTLERFLTPHLEYLNQGERAVR